MTDADTAPPSKVLVSFVLVKADDKLTAREIQHRVTEATGHQPSERTIRAALSGLVAADDVAVVGHDQARGERQYRWDPSQ